MVAWKRNAGRVMCAGDSRTDGRRSVGAGAGYESVGGWRDPLQDLLTAANIAYDFVGPYTDGIIADPEHRGLAGEKASEAKTIIGAQTATYLPQLVICDAWGMNDLGTGATPATYIADYEECLSEMKANTGFCKYLIQTLTYPQTGDYAGYFTNIANYAPAQVLLAASVVLSGDTLIDIGQPDNSGDGIHPIDAAYTTMAAPIYDAILAVIP